MRVLIADDDAVTLRQLSGLLAHLGHEPVAAHDGAEAWAAIQAPDAPALIILDWMMPPPDGVEICRRLRDSGRRPYQYVLLLTARDTVDDVVEGMDAGADDYLRKPFDLRELRVRLRAGERVLALQDELRAQATTDELTRLPNRRGILERLQHELALVRRDGRAFSILTIDIDNFKNVNDAHGHAVGDEVLKHVAARMRVQVRGYDDVGRHGGEEFMVVLPACDPAGAVGVAERIRADIASSPVSTSAGGLTVTVSIGVATIPGAAAADATGLLAAADGALYAAKRNGRNRVQIAPDADASTGPTPPITP
ncbi:MAG TPA: diguanylate cyclase [Burkholderiales bacterium]|nr:diguanylate cyclase [Burkholderiales bacterium]